VDILISPRHVRFTPNNARWAAHWFVDALLFTQFVDKVTIISKSPLFGSGNGEFERELKQVQTLRNLLAHANDYAATTDAASKFG
jgi:hypothetical protein